MSMYNLIEYSSKLSDMADNLWFCSKDEAANFNAHVVKNYNFKSFKYKTKLFGKTTEDKAKCILRNVKHLTNFLRSLKMPRINQKFELKLKWKKHCVVASNGTKSTDANCSNIIYTIKDTKLYDLIVTLSAKDNQKLSKPLRKGFEKSVF